MAIITFYPLVFQVWMSFTDFGAKNFNVRLGIPPNFVGLDNYVRIATSKLQIPNFEFGRLVLFNLWWALSNVVIHVIFGVFVAVLLNTKGLMFRGIYRAIFILPVVIPSIIVATVWRNMFDARRRRGELRPAGDRRAVRDPGRRAGPATSTGCARSTTRSRSSRCRSRSSR